MTRPSNLFMASTAFNQGRNVQALDLSMGSQYGKLPVIGQYISSAPYVRQNLVAVLIEAPSGFQALPDAPKWVAALKALVELAPKSIEGFNQQLQPEVVGTAFGGAGEELEVYKDVKRSRSQITINYFERYGRPISKFFEGWITYLGLDPQSKTANVVTLAGNGITDLLPDVTGMTVLFFEPDPTFQFVDKACLMTAMMPKSAPPVEGSRDVNNLPGDITEFGIEFTGVSQISIGVEQFAQQILQTMSLTGTNPNLQPAFMNAIDADVAAATDGQVDQLNAAASQAIQV